MADQITYDKAYDAVAPGDFPAMLQVARYGRRSDAFDGIISATHDHFWDPLDLNYIDYDLPFDMKREPIMPLDAILELKSAVADRLDDGQKIGLANDVTHWSISNLLHGEQSIQAPRNMRPTRRARRPVTSPASRATSPSVGAHRCPSARPSPPCWVIW